VIGGRDIGPCLVNKPNRIIGTLPCAGITGVINTIRVKLPVGVVFDVVDGEVVADGVLEFVHAPQHDFALALGFDS